MAKTIVILGASFAGVPLAHHLLKHTAPLVPGLKVILVSPNSSFYWNLAVVRGILPDTIPDDKLFFPITPLFAKYPSSQFEFVNGRAEALDPSSNSVTVSTLGGKGRKLSYDTLVIATGTSFREDVPFKNLSTTEETKAALHSWQQKIKAANSIIIAGAGATGVELAGELGQTYALSNQKTVTLIGSDELPLYDKLSNDVRETAKKQMMGLKVQYLGSTKVLSTKATAGGQTLVETSSSSGKTETLTADLFIPTYGVTPNTAFVPAHMLDKEGYVRQDASLRATGHDNIWVLGDVGDLQPSQLINTDDQTVHAAQAVQAQLTGKELPEYKLDTKARMGVSIGPKGGTGQMGTFKLWSWMIWLFKARYLGTDYAGEFAQGLRTVQAKKWA